MKEFRYKGEAALFFANFFYATESILVKKVSAHLSGYLISFFRFSIGLVLSVALILGLKKGFKIKSWPLLIGRAVAGVISMISFYMSVKLGNPGRAMLLNLTFPIFAVVYGFLFFKEKARWQDFMGILLCLGGILLVFYDGSTVPLAANVWGIISGASAGLAVHFIRKAGQEHHTFLLYLVVCVLGIFVSGIATPDWQMLNSERLLLLLIIGSIVFIGQIIMQWGYRHTTAIKGSIISYFNIPITMLLSHFLIGEEFKDRMIMGAGLIISGVVLNNILHWKTPLNKNTAEGI